MAKGDPGLTAPGPSKPCLLPAFFPALSGNSHMWASLRAASVGGTVDRVGGGGGGTRPEGPAWGWGSVSLLPPSRLGHHRARGLFELGCDLGPTAWAPRSVPARAYVQEDTSFRFSLNNCLSKARNRDPRAGAEAGLSSVVSSRWFHSFLFITAGPGSGDSKPLNAGLVFPGSWLGPRGFRVTFPL